MLYGKKMNRFGDNLICTNANEEIVKAFARFGADFLVVGGLAMAWHCPSRQANDMDLLVKPTAENSENVTAALSTLGLTGFEAASFAKPGVQAQLKQRHHADILTPAKDGPSYDAIAADALNGKLFQIPVRIVSRDRLIQLKRDAMAKSEQEAEKHARDIELLQNHAV